MPIVEGFRPSYIAPAAKDGSGDVSRGFRQGWEETKGMGYGTAGLAGAVLGIDRLKEWGLENAEERFDASRALSRPTDQLEGIEGVGSAVDWAQRGLGYVGAQAIPSLVTGGVGATVGRTAVGKTVQALMRRGLQREAQDLLAKAGTRGAITGAGLTSYAQEAGSIYPEMVSEGFDEPGRAALFAVPAAALDVIPEARAARKVLMPAGAGKPRGILRTMAVEAAKQGGIEGGTEMGQTAVERAAAYKPLTGPEAYSEYANAGALGALGGGVLGGAMAPFTGPTELLPDAGLDAPAPTAPAGPPALPPPTRPPMLPPPAPSNRVNYIVDQDGNVIEATRASAPDLALPAPAPYAPPGVVETPHGIEHFTAKPMVAGPLGVARTPQAYQNAEVASRIAGLPVGPQEAPVLPERVAGHPAYTDDRAAGPVPPPGVMPKVSPAAAVVPPKGVAPTLPSWKGAARRAFVSARGRKAALINEILGQPDPQAAAQITRERAYETQSAAELKALDAVHKAITGQTFDEFDAADRTAAQESVEKPAVKTPVDEGAHLAAASPLNGKTPPSKAQAESGNYAKGAVKLGGMDISIENPQGSVRQDKATPSKWKQVMRDHYGYVKGTVGFDKDHLDVFVKPGTPEDWAGTVYVVNQTDRNGKFDEHKAVLGAKSRVDATKIYLRNYPKGQTQNIRSIVEMPLEGFKAWARDTSKKGPKGGELQVRSELTENVEKAEAPQVDATEQARRAWEEDRLDGDPTFDELTLAHQQRVEGAIEDGTWSGATMNEIIDSYKRARRTDRANRAAAEGRAADEKILKPTTRGRKKGAGNAETVRGDEGQVREGSAEGQRGVQRGADEGRQDLQRDQEEDGAEAEQPSLWDETVAAAQRGEIQESIKKPSERGDGGARRAAFTRIIKGLTGDTDSWKVTFYKDRDEAEAAGHEGLRKGTQAWVDRDHAYFILSDIKPGDELAVFLHEVGKHLGMERLLTQEALDRLASRVREWALRDDGSLESKVAAKALERVKLTGNESDVRRNQDGYWRVYNKDGDLVKGIMEKTEEAAVRKGGLYAAGLHEHQSEAVAYFIEEAVKAGVDPTAMSYKTPIGRWMRELWTLFKTALRKLGLKNVDALKAQDVVDLAYGAARGILQTRWHGSPAHFRKFNSKNFRGTGEGRLPFNEDRSDYRDMIAWGTYLADRRGTATEYRDRLSGDRVRLGDGRVLEANENFWTPEGEPDSPFVMAYNTLVTGLHVERSRGSNAIGVAKSELDAIIENAQGRIEMFEGATSPDEELIQKYTTTIANATEAKNLLNEWARKGKLEFDKGALYATDTTIADDEWLDWEKGFHQQSPKVQEKMRELAATMALGPEGVPTDYWKRYFTEAISGKELYGSFESVMPSQKAVSELLDKHGIKGVRYLDAGSRRYTPGKITIQAPFASKESRVTFDLTSAPVESAAMARAMRAAGAFDNTYLGTDRDAQLYVVDLINTLAQKGKANEFGALVRGIRQAAASGIYPSANDIIEKDFDFEGVKKAMRFVHIEKPPKPTYNYVVFNDKNIVTVKKDPKSASEARQYSVADRREAMEKAATIGEAVGVNILGKARRGLLKLQFLRDIREQFASLAGIRQHVDRIFEMSSSANDYIKAAGKIAKRWSSLNNDEMAKLDELAPMATVMEIHPDVPLDREMHLQASGREITNAHLADDAGNFPADVVAAHAELQRKWNTLQPHTKAVYKAARDSMAANWDKRQELLNKVVYRHFNGEIEKARAAKNELMVKALERERDGFVKEYGRLLARVKGPYFPLMRFGDFFVVYKSEKYQGLEKQLVEASDKLKALYTKHQVPMEEIGAIDALNNALEEINLPQIAKMPPEARAEIKEARKAVATARKEMESLQDKDEHYSNQAFESESAARKEAERLGVEVRLKEDYLRELSGVNFAMINKIGQAIEASVGEKVASQAREAMMQVWLQSLPDKSALRRELKRKKIAGYSTDSMRAFSSYSQRDAHYLSRLEHMDDIVDSLMQLRRETRGKGLEREEVYNELARRYAASLKFSDTPVQDAITATAFIYQLGISPAFLLTNLSQPWMISMPLLAARHGIGRANAQLAKAFSEIGKAAKASLKDQKTWFFEINTGNFSDGEQQMFSKALRQGLLDITLEYDLGAMARGGETKFNKATRMMSVLPHQVEVVNRMMTGLAAYRMEMQRSRGNQAQAEEYAMDVLAKTHFDYSAANAPYVMKPGVVPFGKVLFQYRKYQLGVLTLFARQIGKALKGASAEERNEARAALLGLVTMHGALAGAMGLPFMGTALFAANVLQNVFGDDDEPWDSETALRNWLSDVLGVKLGAAAAKGLPMLAGLDVTNKVGAGSVLAPIRILRDNKEGRDLYLEFLAASVGPAMGGLMPRFWEGISLMGDGNILKAGEMFTPKFVSDTVKAARVATEGIVTKAGNTAMKPEEADAWDVALQAIGIPPSQITEVTAAMGAVEEAKRELNDRRAELKKAYVKARVEGAQDKLIEVQREIQAFNEKRKARGEPMLKPADLIAAFKQREGYDKTRIAPGVRLPKNQAGLAAYARFADTQ